MEDTETQVDIPAPDANAAPETEESVAESSPAKADENKETVSKVQSRFDELTKHRREAEREAEKARRDAEYWREQALLRQREQPPEPVKAPIDEPLKTEADFDFDSAKYQQYIVGESQRRAVEAAKRELQAERDRQTKAQRDASFASRSKEFAKTVDDFDEVVKSDYLTITPDMAEVIKESDDGPALAYHLGKNPDVAAKIAQLPPIVAARELGKIEARLAIAREQASAKAVSKTPPPPPKIEGTNPTTSVKPDLADSDKLSDAEWMRLRNKQAARRSK